MSETNLGNGSPKLAERAVRRRVLQGAHAAFNNEFSAVPCRVKNISQTGALLEFENPDCVPTKFTLHVALERYKIECRTVRKDKNWVGVEFCGEKQETNLARFQTLKMSDSHSSAAETKETELREILQQRRQESLLTLHLQEKKKASEEQPVGRKTVVAFGKRV
ncbi:MAG: hypothetical protein COB78_06740 [Hyphomicrobiales bacterium]|nr:MAG: hypothetical protein COB78_06740 [Hyphomicrobiales bacterium]